MNQSVHRCTMPGQNLNWLSGQVECADLDCSSSSVGQSGTLRVKLCERDTGGNSEWSAQKVIRRLADSGLAEQKRSLALKEVCNRSCWIVPGRLKQTVPGASRSSHLNLLFKKTLNRAHVFYYEFGSQLLVQLLDSFLIGCNSQHAIEINQEVDM